MGWKKDCISSHNTLLLSVKKILHLLFGSSREKQWNCMVFRKDMGLDEAQRETLGLEGQGILHFLDLGLVFFFCILYFWDFVFLILFLFGICCFLWYDYHWKKYKQHQTMQNNINLYLCMFDNLIVLLCFLKIHFVLLYFVFVSPKRLHLSCRRHESRASPLGVDDFGPFCGWLLYIKKSSWNLIPALDRLAACCQVTSSSYSHDIHMIFPYWMLNHESWVVSFLRKRSAIVLTLSFIPRLLVITVVSLWWIPFWYVQKLMFF